MDFDGTNEDVLKANFQNLNCIAIDYVGMVRFICYYTNLSKRIPEHQALDKLDINVQNINYYVHVHLINLKKLFDMSLRMLRSVL